MPQIVVTAGSGLSTRAGREVMRERVVASDLESELFVSHLVERIEWALADADSIEARQRRRREATDHRGPSSDSASRSPRPTRSHPIVA